MPTIRQLVKFCIGQGLCQPAPDSGRHQGVFCTPQGQHRHFQLPQAGSDVRPCAQRPGLRGTRSAANGLRHLLKGRGRTRSFRMHYQTGEDVKDSIGGSLQDRWPDQDRRFAALQGRSPSAKAL